jgi:hypothetical protein
MPCDRLEHRVRAIACVELSENVRHVILDRADGDAEVSSDLLVGIPTAHEPQDRCLLLRHRLLLPIWVFLTLSACGTTRRFVDQPQLIVDGADETPRQATAELFDGITPHKVSLCEADPVSKDCKKGSDGVRANGVGGLFLPLILNVNGMTVSKQSPSDSGWAIDAAVQSKADGIPPLCRIAHGQILSRDNNTITVKLQNFYCNWLAVGNVLVNADRGMLPVPDTTERLLCRASRRN